MKFSLLSLMFFAAALCVHAQDDTVSIRIKLIDGRTGLPMKVQKIAIEDRAGYRDISVRPDSSGEATLRASRDTTILTHNTHEYVNCGDEHGGLVHNDYSVRKIVSTGVVEPVAQPNLCTQTSGAAKPGELILFVRPWRIGEEL